MNSRLYVVLFPSIQRGATLLEYVMLLSLISLCVVGTVVVVGNRTANVFCSAIGVNDHSDIHLEWDSVQKRCVVAFDTDGGGFS